MDCRKRFLSVLICLCLLLTACGQAADKQGNQTATDKEHKQLSFNDVLMPMSESEADCVESISRNVYSPSDNLPEGMITESELSKDDDPQIIYIGKPREEQERIRKSSSAKASGGNAGEGNSQTAVTLAEDVSDSDDEYDEGEDDDEDEDDEETWDESYDDTPSLFESRGEKGIDVSKYNGKIDWKQVKEAGISYAIIRCAYRGSSTGYMVMDPRWEDNYLGARRAGIKTGTYFFTQAISEEEASKEASLVCALIKGTGLDLPVFIDVEGSGGRADSLDRETRTRIISAFVETIQDEGYKAGVYSNKTWFNNYIYREDLPPETYIWYAQYGVSKPTYTGSYDIWQYSSTGSVPGIEGDVDMNMSID